MKQIEIGPGLTCDLDRLIASRMLVQANSGGGKTRTVRRLLEQSFGQVQHLVIDPEGEYHTLRERFDYVLASPKGGDTAAHPRTAALLAERLLSLGVSAILDIYDLDPDARRLFVKRFVEALVNADRSLWHPTLIVLDEAHNYAPEGKENDSTGAVKFLASAGRKRGYCLVAATQRLAKLSKDVAAELNNKLVGRCTLDVDIKRAAEELGFTTNEQKLGLRQLDPGVFFAYGPAFATREVVKVLVGPVKTTHPEPGQQAAPTPPPTAHVRKLLEQLADLPAEAEEREKSLETLKRENAQLRRELTLAQRSQRIVETFVLKDGQLARAEKLIERAEALSIRFSEFEEDLRVTAKEIRDAIAATRVPHPPREPRRLESPRPVSTPTSSRPVAHVVGDGDVRLNRLAERRILQVLSQFGPRTLRQVAIQAGYAMSGGGFRGALSKLRTHGLLVSNGALYDITDAGRAAIGDVEPLPTGAALVAYWMQQFNRLAEREVLRVLVEAYPKSLSREEIASRTNPPYESEGGGFRGALSKLRTLGLIEGRGALKASDDLN